MLPSISNWEEIICEFFQSQNKNTNQVESSQRSVSTESKLSPSQQSGLSQVSSPL